MLDDKLVMVGTLWGEREGEKVGENCFSSATFWNLDRISLPLHFPDQRRRGTDWRSALGCQPRINNLCQRANLGGGLAKKSLATHVACKIQNVEMRGSLNELHAASLKYLLQ